jgi:hypothetical protein
MAEQIIADGRFSGLFPGWGQTRILAMKGTKKHDVEVVADTDTVYAFDRKKKGFNKGHTEHKANLNTLLSVSIAGCDLMGSCLYTAGVCTVNSGKVSCFNFISCIVC